VASDLVFRVSAELTEIKAALAGLQRDIGAVGKVAQRSGGEAAFKGVDTGARSALGSVGRLVAALATVATAVRLIGAADELNTLNARLRLVTNGTEEFNRAQVELFGIAQRTRSGLGETVKLYSQIANATKDAKVGQQVLLDVVETVNQAVQLSGSGAAASEAALVQLGQGLASGTLRGEELNSILEQTPALADAIAKGMGITRGELRKYGEEGKITAQQVIEALQKQKDEVAAQFAQLPLTVGQAVTLLKNAGLQIVGAFDTTGGATAGIASVIKQLADFLSSDEVVGAVIEFAATWSNAFEQIVGDVQEARRIIAQATKGITGEGETIFDFIGRAFRELPANVRAAVQIATVNVAAFVDSTITSMRGVAEYIRAVFDPSVTIEQVRARLLRAQAAIEQARADSVDAALAERQRAINDAKAARDDAIKARERARSTRGSTSQGKFTTQLTDAQKREAEALRKAELDAEEKLLKDSTQRQLGTLQDLYDDGLIAARDYFARRQAIELEALDRAIATEKKRAAGATSAADRKKAETDAELLERQRGDIVLKAARDTAQAQRDIDKQVADARAQDLENQGQLAAAASIRLEAQFADLLKKLGKDSEGAKLVQKLIDTGVAKARFEELQRIADAALQRLERRLADIQAGVRSGAIAPDQAKDQGAAARTQAFEDLVAINRQQQEIAAATGDPQAIEAANRTADAIRRLKEESQGAAQVIIGDLRAALQAMSDSLAQATTSAGVDALSNFFTDLASGTKTGKEALRDFVASFAQSMAQIAARALATFLVLQLLDAIYPGLAQLTVNSAAVDKQANVLHAGGMAGTGPKRQVPGWIFAGAPRLHSGGSIGLKPDEVPAILQTGERVLSRQEVAAGDGAAPGGGTRIVNVLDPNLMQDYLTTPAGERVILNVIERNAGAVKQRLT